MPCLFSSFLSRHSSLAETRATRRTGYTLMTLSRGPGPCHANRPGAVACTHLHPVTQTRAFLVFYTVTQKMLTITAESRGAETRAFLPCHAPYPVTLVTELTVGRAPDPVRRYLSFRPPVGGRATLGRAPDPVRRYLSFIHTSRVKAPPRRARGGVKMKGACCRCGFRLRMQAPRVLTQAFPTNAQ